MPHFTDGKIEAEADYLKVTETVGGRVKIRGDKTENRDRATAECTKAEQFS